MNQLKSMQCFKKKSQNRGENDWFLFYIVVWNIFLFEQDRIMILIELAGDVCFAFIFILCTLKLHVGTKLDVGLLWSPCTDAAVLGIYVVIK